MVRIITDSTSNLSEEMIAELGIRVAPISIQFGNETYEEGITIDRDLFYEKIEKTGVMPTSSQPTPAWFVRYFTEIAENGESGLVITVTGEHSGTYDTALMAKAMVPEADIEVFDSRSISFGTGWMVLEAARAIKRGYTRDQILSRLMGIRERARLFLTPETLKYLRMSGRVGRLQDAFASLLSVKPIISLVDGRLHVDEKVRTRKKSLESLIKHLKEAFGSEQPINLAVMHARAAEDGETLRRMAEDVLNVTEILSGDLTPSLAVHGGPGVVGVFAYPRESISG
ncbi:MAG: DegV family protein [Anaerolineales bacterium]